MKNRTPVGGRQADRGLNSVSAAQIWAWATTQGGAQRFYSAIDFIG